MQMLSLLEVILRLTVAVVCHSLLLIVPWTVPGANFHDGRTLLTNQRKTRIIAMADEKAVEQQQCKAKQMRFWELEVTHINDEYSCKDLSLLNRSCASAYVRNAVTGNRFAAQLFKSF